ncbi:MAG: ABC transporter ATP-binding protein [Planctomycetota bacterium]
MGHTIELRGVTVDYGAERPALAGIDLAVDEGELVTVVGPSGCGKSTLLRVIAGLVPQTSGEVWIAGERVDGREPGERDIAVVFQSYALYPHMSVRANLEFPLRMRRAPRVERRKRAEEVAEMLGLRDLLERKPHQLSGGQMQRVAIGRALVRRPRAFLLDEPLSNLDTRLREDVRAELRRLFRDLGATVLYVTHDQVGAVTLGDRICVLGEGRVHALGRPLELLARPPSTFVADLLGSPPLNLIRGAVRGAWFEAGSLRIDAAGRAEGPVVLGLAPTELDLEGAHAHSDAFPCVVRDVERTGARTVARVQLGPSADSQRRGFSVADAPALRVVLQGDRALAPGQAAGLLAGPATPHWFDAETGARC